MFKNIMVAIDGSKTSMEALMEATRMAASMPMIPSSRTRRWSGMRWRRFSWQETPNLRHSKQPS